MWILPWQCCQPLKCTRVTHAWFWFGRSKKDASRLRSNRSLRAAHTLSNKAPRDPRVAAGHAQWLPRLWASHGPQFAAPNLTAVCFSRWKQACQDRMKWKLLSHVQLFVTPMDCSPPGSSVHGILQARMLKWAAIPFPKGSSRGSNLGLLHCRQILCHLSHQGSPFGVRYPTPNNLMGGVEDTSAPSLVLFIQNQESHQVFQFSEAQQAWLSSNLCGSLESSWCRERSVSDLKWRIIENEIQSCTVFT